MRELLEEVLYRWQERDVGNTKTLVDGALETDCQILVKDKQQEIDLLKRGVDKNKIVHLDQLPHALLGMSKPLVVDHFVLGYMIRLALKEAFADGMKYNKIENQCDCDKCTGYDQRS